MAGGSLAIDIGREAGLACHLHSERFGSTGHGNLGRTLKVPTRRNTGMRPQDGN